MEDYIHKKANFIYTHTHKLPSFINLLPLPLLHTVHFNLFIKSFSRICSLKKFNKKLKFTSKIK